MIRTVSAAAAAAFVALAPLAALAHGGPEGHGHPHGLEVAILGAVALVVALVWAEARR